VGGDGKVTKRLLAMLVTVLAAISVSAGGSQGAAPHPITIGVMSDCVGYWSFAYDDTLAGAELALIERGATPLGPTPGDGVGAATVAGHPVRLVRGCLDGTATTAIVQARMLVEREHVDVLIGPLAGNEEVAVVEYARTRPDTVFVDGSASTHFQDPPTNFFSFHADAIQWMAGLGGYAYTRLHWRRVVTITAEPDLFDWGETAGFLAEFCSLGGSVAKRISVPPGTSDYSRIIAQVPPTGVDGFFLAGASGIGGVGAAALARAYPGLAGNISRKLILGIGDFTPLRRLGNRMRGLVSSDRAGPGLSPGSRYARRLRRTFPGLDPTLVGGGVFVADYYTAMKATLQALAQAKSDLSNGERTFATALSRVEFDAPAGHIHLDALHRAVQPIYLLQARKPDFSDQRLIRTIPNVDASFGGYFTRHDPPPTATSPVCKKRTPPAWASTH
jgi:branched-chain amino acid transport system substrate-binding protein